MNNPKDITEKILKAFDNQFIDAASMIIDCRDLARAYLKLEKKIANKNISIAGLDMDLDSYKKQTFNLKSEITKLKEENEKLSEMVNEHIKNATLQYEEYKLLHRKHKELETKLSLEQQDRESEKRTYKTRIEAAEGYITELKIKLILANNTIHGEFCGEKCHPLHLEVNI